jgi:hypothetical protein
MSKLVAAMVLFTSALVALAAGSSCSSTPGTTLLTDCTTFTPADAGMDPDLTCAIGWSCNSGDTQLQITCTQDVRPEYYDCSCSNGTTTTQSIVVDFFPCNPMGSLPTANMGCNFNISP